jgi:hypothetical protein
MEVEENTSSLDCNFLESFSLTISFSFELEIWEQEKMMARQIDLLLLRVPLRSREVPVPILEQMVVF